MTKNPDFCFDNFVREIYLTYGMATLLDRALPSIRDGLKPVQRRIIYGMSRMRLAPESKPVKSARVVGEVMGRFHPHGDSAIYEAIVNIAQDFNARYPLVDGQGNWGSRDGDAPAAMRYTECRLTPYAALLTADLDRSCTPFRSNYDGSDKEPEFLPARMPMHLLNGASGIAVGMTTKIPSHNLGEVADALLLLLKKPDAQVADIMQVMPGPDFACGAALVSTPEEIASVYETGTGKLRLRATWKVEQLSRGQWRIVVTSLPQQVSPSQVLERIDSLVNPKPGKKKDISQEQKRIRQQILSLISDMRDESAAGQVRLVFEPKSRNLEPEMIMRLLMKLTPMETTFSVAMTALDLSGRPRCMGLLEHLRQWLDFRIETVTKRFQSRLAQVMDRLHVLEGRLKAFASLDEIIAIIRNSDDPKADLMANFGFDERQADDILSIRLRQLAKLERVEIEKEQAALTDEKQKIEAILQNNTSLRKVIAGEIREIKKKYADTRRTLLAPEAESDAEMMKATVPSDPVTLVLSRHGWIRSRQGHGVDVSALSWKSGDALLATVETMTDADVVVMDEKGRCYRVSASDVPGGKGNGVPLSSLIAINGNKPVAILADHPDAVYLSAASNGYGFKSQFSVMLPRRRGGREFLSVPEGHKALAPVRIPDEDAWVVVETTEGRKLAFDAKEVKMLDRGKGVKLIALKDGEQVSAIKVTTASDQDIAPFKGRRGRRGF